MGVIAKEKADGKMRYEVYTHYNGKTTYIGSFDNKRHSELVSLIWENEEKHKSKHFTKEQAEIAESNGIDMPLLRKRIAKLGWDIEKAITQPPRSSNQSKNSRKRNRVVDLPEYDKVINYIIKNYVHSKEFLYKEFPEMKAEIIEAAWKSAKEINLC